jgi:hypothetical protein
VPAVSGMIPPRDLAGCSFRLCFLFTLKSAGGRDIVPATFGTGTVCYRTALKRKPFTDPLHVLLRSAPPPNHNSLLDCPLVLVGSHIDHSAANARMACQVFGR